ncbi:DUF2490 domain-containing protein [Ichthyenterobacterium sp. W332]|uniref:DUF2490 domain-containing protein n=1 Tax=Microcosmobacter mediterraneus TaxID=3075607 RepID=A0ABU2YJ02_9FLAO|nr:DUF2490 domain-containing protein [Ichthyenterobacterium sp. W332]MDT0558136.1 DUF2490 domain-containing protein [Ichthyenterobacterium sp. W332]
MFCTKSFLVFLITFACLNLYAQENFESLGETALSLNHSVNTNYKINFAVRSRYYLYQDDNFNFENRQLDVVHFSTLNLDYNNSFSLGIQYRFRETIDGGSNELRLTQQYNYTKNNNALRFGHRLRFEQRFLDNIIIIRTRYRFALDFPLNGQKIDIGETYIVSSAEFLVSKSAKIKPQLDQRTTVQLGWFFSEKLKFQFGFEYRFEEFNRNTEEKLFVLSSLILKV